MKTLSTIAVAVFLGLTGAATAGDSGENHQDSTNATGANPYMASSGPYRAGGYAAYGQQMVVPHVVKHHVKR